MSKKALNDDQIKEMNEMYGTHSQRAIAEYFRVSRRTIQRELARTGTLNPTISVTPSEHNLILKLREKGLLRKAVHRLVSNGIPVKRVAV